MNCRHKASAGGVLGGDGNALGGGPYLRPNGFPILSVNLGALGFLTEVRLADLYTTLEVEGWVLRN